MSTVHSATGRSQPLKFRRITRPYDRSSRKSWDARIRRTDAVGKHRERWWGDAIPAQRRWHRTPGWLTILGITWPRSAQTSSAFCSAWILIRIASPVGMQKHSWNSLGDAPSDRLLDRTITIFQLAQAVHWLDAKSWLRVNYTEWFILSEERMYDNL